MQEQQQDNDKCIECFEKTKTMWTIFYLHVHTNKVEEIAVCQDCIKNYWGTKNVLSGQVKR